MAKTIAVNYRNQQELAAAVRGVDTATWVLAGLAAIGRPVVRLADKAGARLAAWKEARKQRRDDERLWNLALQDARIMADLSRAMSREAVRNARYY
jgi:phosphoglycerate dehydrogenase-like enzyme